MNTTSVKITFGLYASIKDDAALDTSGIQEQPFSSASDVKKGAIAGCPYITLEPDYWLLDGTYKFMPDVDPRVGIMSANMSDGSGNFDAPPILKISFSEPHSIGGITLKFAEYSGDYCNSLALIYRNAAGAVIASDVYDPSGISFSSERAVDGFQAIEITFLSTNRPFRYFRLTGVDFGNLITFTKVDIKSASVVQQVDPISTVNSIDTFELDLWSSEAAFSIINPTGDYAQLHNKQPIEVTETIDGEDIYIGRFYLDEWENKTENVIHFRCFDAMGVLDSIPYLGGIIDGRSVKSELDRILGDTGFQYEIDDALAAIPLRGLIPICSCREALHQVVFAIGAYITCSRTSFIKIKKTVLAKDIATPDYTITKAEKGMEQSVALKTLVTGVEITSHQYAENTDATQLYNDVLAAGQQTIEFTAPMHSLTITGASIVESGSNYAVLSVPIDGIVTLVGLGYDDIAIKHGIYTSDLPAGTVKNTLSIPSATLINEDNADEACLRVYEYHQQRFWQKVKLFVSLATPGSTAEIDTLYNQKISGVVESMSIDLAGGFISQTDIIGAVA